MRPTSSGPSVFTVRKYRGKSKSGALKVTDERGRYEFEGECTVLKFEDGGFVTKVDVFEEVPADGDGSQPVHVFVAVGARTKKLYLIRGELIRTWPVEQRASTRKAMALADYQTEIQRIKASQELGLDPVVSMPFVILHSGRSGATVYRDIAAGHLAKALKRGASSAWPFSAVDAYARGQRPGPVSESA